MKTIIILGSNGEIGNFLSENLSDTYTVLKANRNTKDQNYIDFSDRDSISHFIKNNINENIYGIINCYGVQKPIGDFTNTDFDDWEENIMINFQNYSFFIHNVLNQNLPNLKKVINFAGGGAIAPRKGFSSYAISKISLYKLTEILAEECRNDKIDFNIIAPGAIKSRMTEEIINSVQLGDEYSSALEVHNTGGDNIENILTLCRLLLSSKSDGVTGKLISAQWDNLKESDLDILKNDNDLFNLRRIDEKFFIKKKDIK